MAAVSVAWAALGDTDRQLLADLANAAAVYVRSLGATNTFPTLFASSSTDAVAQWERAYDSAIATVAGPSVAVVSGQSGGGAGAPDWSTVLATQPAAAQLATAHQAIAQHGTVLRYSVSDAPLREWLYLRAGRDSSVHPPVTTPVTDPSSSSLSTTSKFVIGAAILIALSKGRR